jgi:hypothetical protein
VNIFSGRVTLGESEKHHVHVEEAVVLRQYWMRPQFYTLIYTLSFTSFFLAEMKRKSGRDCVLDLKT